MVSPATSGCCATPSCGTRWQIEHIETHRNGSTLVKVGAFAAGLVHFGWALLRRRPDVVHLHMGAYGSFVRKAVLVWIAAAAGVPAIVHVHGSDFDIWHDRLPRPLRAVIRATLHRAAVVVALGDRWADRLRAIAPRVSVVTVPNAVRVPPAPRTRGRGPLHVVFLGEIGERKGAFNLLETWAKLAAEPDVLAGARLTMAGDRETERAERRIDELGIAGSAAVSSWLSFERVAELLSGADIFVLPSRNEGQPMALLEAMANGMAVVVSDVGGSRRWSRTGGPGCSSRPTTRTPSPPPCAGFCPMWTFGSCWARPHASGCSTDSTSTWSGDVSTPSIDR